MMNPETAQRPEYLVEKKEKHLTEMAIFFVLARQGATKEIINGQEVLINLASYYTNAVKHALAARALDEEWNITIYPPHATQRLQIHLREAEGSETHLKSTQLGITEFLKEKIRLHRIAESAIKEEWEYRRLR